jgi:glutathione peroxidase-family protein
MGQANEPDDFYALSVTTAQGKKVPLENYDGYVVLFAVVPLLKDSGMAQYYYELLEHVQSIFKYTIEIVLLPVQVETMEEEAATDIQPHAHDNAKVVLLKKMTGTTKTLDYLLNVPPTAGSLVSHEDKNLHLLRDRVTIFIVSSDGKFVERLISPTMAILERRLIVYLSQLDGDTTWRDL